jgi:cytochrome b561
VNRRTLAALAVALGNALIAIAVVHWVEPAKSLPSFFPGHQAIHQNAPYFLTFLVALHLATALVLLAFFWRDTTLVVS